MSMAPITHRENKMINQQIRLEGRQKYEERLGLGKKYIVYRSEHDARTHAFMDGHTHLAQHCSASPRLFFTSTRGSSGKTRTSQLSYFFVQYPILATASGASLIWEFNKGIELGHLPTVIYDEAQEVWKPPGNEPVQALFNSYLKGFPRTVWLDGEPKQLQLYCSVIMNGLVTKYYIPPNFLERCIQVSLFKKLDTENIDDFEFGDLIEEIGTSLRIPRSEWSMNFKKEDIKSFRPTISAKLKDEGITSRDAELWKPLCEYAYLCGDDTFDSAIEAAKYSLKKTEDRKQYTLKEKLLIDIHSVFSNKKVSFIPSDKLCKELNAMADRPWRTYKTNSEFNQHNLAFLLEDYNIKPEKDSSVQLRGYYTRMFSDIWERDFGLRVPD